MHKYQDLKNDIKNFKKKLFLLFLCPKTSNILVISSFKTSHILQLLHCLSAIKHAAATHRQKDRYYYRLQQTNRQAESVFHKVKRTCIYLKMIAFQASGTDSMY